MERTLVSLLKVLNESGLCAAARLTPDGKVGLWLGDHTRRIHSFAFFRPEELDRAARWLSEQAATSFPTSTFARDARTIAALAHGGGLPQLPVSSAESRRPPSPR